jgi:TIR domain
MFSILVAADGLAWEKENVMTIELARFKEYSGVESERISVENPESLASLEAVDALLMYETGAEGSNVGAVRVGRTQDIRAGKTQIVFRFRELGRIERSFIQKHHTLVDLAPFEFDRTHWAIKDGNPPDIVREAITVSKKRYDVALSFAGQDRLYVGRVADFLHTQGVAVFYDEFKEVDLWGKDLAEHLDSVYRTGAQYCVIFISEHYAKKMWPNHERRSALARSVESKREYILPSRFDSTELPGLRPTIGYVDLAAKCLRNWGH